MHISLDRINRITKDGLLKYLSIGSLPIYEFYLEGKMTKRPFTTNGLRAEEPLGLIHSDVHGLFFTQARRGYEYYVTFIDDYSRYRHVYLIRESQKLLKSSRSFVLKLKSS